MNKGIRGAAPIKMKLLCIKYFLDINNKKRMQKHSFLLKLF